MDDSLARQLEPWPSFRKQHNSHSDDGEFVNHCPHCSAPQEDLQLSSEPDQPFFSIAHAAPGTIKLKPLIGQIQLSGDESFEV